MPRSAVATRTFTHRAQSNNIFETHPKIEARKIISYNFITSAGDILHILIVISI